MSISDGATTVRPNFYNIRNVKKKSLSGENVMDISSSINGNSLETRHIVLRSSRGLIAFAWSKSVSRPIVSLFLGIITTLPKLTSRWQPCIIVYVLERAIIDRSDPIALRLLTLTTIRITRSRSRRCLKYMSGWPIYVCIARVWTRKRGIPSWAKKIFEVVHTVGSRYPSTRPLKHEYFSVSEKVAP